MCAMEDTRYIGTATTKENNMTDTKELNSLIQAIRAKGGNVTVVYDTEGYIDTVQFSGVKGIGPYPCSPIAAVEVMRKVLFTPMTVAEQLKASRI